MTENATQPKINFCSACGTALEIPCESESLPKMSKVDEQIDERFEVWAKSYQDSGYILTKEQVKKIHNCRSDSGYETDEALKQTVLTLYTKLEEAEQKLEDANEGLLKCSDPSRSWQGIKVECKLWQNRAEKAETELADIKDTYNKVINEKCPTDEVHCACVPFLKMELAEFKDKVDWYFECLILFEYFDMLDDLDILESNLFVEIINSLKQAESDLRDIAV